MSTIMNMLQRMTAPPPAAEIPPTVETPLAIEIPPAVEIPPSETIQTHGMTSTSRYSIPATGRTFGTKKVDEAITRRKNRERPIFIKEYPFTEELMNVHLPFKFKEPTGDFDGTTDPINHI
ncbi:hypothetical protein Fot_32307 [Forsythia ovata]|uniref:Reverse transcriptase domain-containing protein n=1 Tax=Forsythia ovata TaxID=205694 RepID=A0ABD1T7J7_9LAMI